MSEIIKFVSGKFNSINKSSGCKFSQYRKVSYYEIEIFTNNYFYTNINKKRYNYTKNTIIIAKPNDIRNSKLHFDCQYIHIEFNDGALKDFFDSAPHAINITNVEKYQAVFDGMSKLFVKNTSNYQALALMYTLVALLQNDISNMQALSNKHSESINIFYSALSYIENHYKENITIDSISKHVNLHPNYFIRMFKKAYGKTPIEYLQEIRIKHAKHLLINTDKKIGEIGLDCGFNSQTYFTFVFTKLCNVSPIQFKNQYKRPL